MRSGSEEKSNEMNRKVKKTRIRNVSRKLEDKKWQENGKKKMRRKSDMYVFFKAQLNKVVTTHININEFKNQIYIEIGRSISRPLTYLFEHFCGAHTGGPPCSLYYEPYRGCFEEQAQLGFGLAG
jgi:hypothetical protein